MTPPDKTKVLILGQDPYINGEAHGLAFSSQLGVTPSLRVIFRELTRVGIQRTDPNLTDWAEQGVLLLNTILTTKQGQSLAHKDFGWQEFTTEIIRHVISLQHPIVVMLWGRVAQDFYKTAVPGVHDHVLVLKAYHPAAESRPGGYKFTGCNHFIDANEFLVQHGEQPIKWSNQ